MTPPSSLLAPPRLAQWLLRLLLSAEEHETILGDLNEAHQREQRSSDRRTADRRYWRETFAAIGLLSVSSVNPGIDRVGDSRVRKLLVDVGYTLRALRRSSTYTIVCVLSLGMSLGGLATVAGIARPLLLNPVPYDTGDRLLMIRERAADGSATNTSYSTFLDVRRSSAALDASAVFAVWSPTATVDGTAEALRGLRVSAGYFDMLHVTPSLGRGFTAEDDTPGAAPVVLVSHDFWQRQLNGDNSAIGKTMLVGDVPNTIIGVLPPTFDDVFQPHAQIWRPLRYGPATPNACRTCRHLKMIGRIRPSVTPAIAADQIDQTLQRLATIYPTDYATPGGLVVPLHEVVRAEYGATLTAILAATVLLLLFAVTNVAHLQLGRAMRRESEFALRLALGASRLDLARHLLTEAIVLLLLATVFGWTLSYLALPLLTAQLPPSMPRVAAVTLDVTTLAVLALASAAATVAVGLLPAWRVNTATLADALRSGGRSRGTRRRTLRRVLITTQVALALMFVAGAGLLGRTLARLYAVERGFSPAHLLTASISATGKRYDTPGKIFNHHEAAMSAAQRVAGVQHVAISNQLPLSGSFDTWSVEAQDKPLLNPALAPYADRYAVSPSYFSVMGIAIRSGRTMRDEDNVERGRRIAVISEALASQLWPGENAVGKRLSLEGTDSSAWRDVVGVVANVRHHGLADDRALQVYVPYKQWSDGDGTVTLIVQTAREVEETKRTLATTLADIDRSQPVGAVESMSEVMARSLGKQRLALMVFSLYAALAAILAGVGLFGLLATSVADREREIGIRVALGATSGRILSLVGREGAALVAGGLLLGLGGAITIGRFLQSLLYGVEPADLPTLLAAAAAMAMVGVISTAVPTSRALLVEPASALRRE